MNRPIKYLQTDPRWSFKDYSAPGEKSTIGNAGCGPTAMAMVIASLVDNKVTPETCCNWSLAHGYKAPNQGTYYSYFKPQGAAYGLKVNQMNYVSAYHNRGATIHAEALKWLRKGNWIISCMGPGRWTSTGHFILVYAIDNKYVYINDPASNNSNKEKALITDWLYDVKYYFSIEIPKKEDYPDMTKEEVIQIVKEILEGKNTTPSSFAKDDWTKAINEGITTGERPQGYATRQEVISLIYNAKGVK